MADPVRVSQGIADNPIGGQLVTIEVEPDFHAGTEKIPAEVRLVRETYRVLMEHYPGHAWGIQARLADGLLGITIPQLLGDWHYWLHLNALRRPTFEDAVIDAGGQIL